MHLWPALLVNRWIGLAIFRRFATREIERACRELQVRNSRAATLNLPRNERRDAPPLNFVRNLRLPLYTLSMYGTDLPVTPCNECCRLYSYLCGENSISLRLLYIYIYISLGVESLFDFNFCFFFLAYFNILHYFSVFFLLDTISEINDFHYTNVIKNETILKCLRMVDVKTFRRSTILY